MKYFPKIMLGLDVLQRGSMEDRLYAFYEKFGGVGKSGSITFWKRDEIAEVISLKGSEKNPREKMLSILRSKMVKKGLLKKVVEPDGAYTWEVVKGEGLHDRALEIINSKTHRDITYCRKDQIPYLMSKTDLDKIPNIVLWDEDLNWDDIFPDLVDFSEAETWEFWPKAMNAVSGKGHPLVGIKDKELRLQVAMTGIEKGLKRNTKNPDWIHTIKDHYGWTIHSLTLVGKDNEPDWKPENVDYIKTQREKAIEDGGYETVLKLAKEAAKEMHPDAQDGTGTTNETESYQEPSQPENVAHSEDKEVESDYERQVRENMELDELLN